MKLSSCMTTALLAAALGAPGVRADEPFGDDERMWRRMPGTGATAQLDLVATYDTGLGANGAEILSVRKDGRAVLTNVAGSVDVLDLSRPETPLLLRRVTLDPLLGPPNSVAIHPFRDYFLVVAGGAGQVGSVGAYRLSDGQFLASAAAGIQPDSVAIAPLGLRAVVANEAEGTGVGQNGGAGSISVVDLLGFDPEFPAPLHVTEIGLPSLAGVAGVSSGRTDDAARVSIDNSPATLEPESVAFSPSGRYAFVSLQENNALARLDLVTHELRFFGTGQTTHAADLVVDGDYDPIDALTAFREPDGVAVTHNGRYVVTADEGDTRDAAGSSGPRGGRTVSIFNAKTGALVADTGSQLDDAAATAGAYPDNRSNRGGSEPEGLDVTLFRGRSLVAVGLERANAVALVDISRPTAPRTLAVGAVGAGPEGIQFLRRGQDLYVLSANEVAGTVSILKVGF